MGRQEKRALINSLLGSAFYVGIGTINFLAKWDGESNTVIELLRLIIILLTFPVTILSFGVFYGGGYDALYLILPIQFATFILTWYMVNKELRAKYTESHLFNEYAHVKKMIAALDINMAETYTWQYTFTSRDQITLSKFLEHLLERGYSLESLNQNNFVTWTMEVSKVEILSAEKLAKRNIKFIELVEDFKLQSYEGWDFKERISTFEK